MLQYRVLTPPDLSPPLFAHFQRHQTVTRCWRKIDGHWLLKDIPFTEDWSPQDLRRVCAQLSRAIASGGTAWAAFLDGALKGFSSVEGTLTGSRKQYAVLAELHVSEDCRRRGIGRELFLRAAAEARRLGAEKLYISAMSAEESQAFYRSMGCVEAQEYNPYLVEKEPCDCQMEYPL